MTPGVQQNRLEVMALNPLQLNVLKAVHGASLVQDVAPGLTSPHEGTDPHP